MPGSAHPSYGLGVLTLAGSGYEALTLRSLATFAGGTLLGGTMLVGGVLIENGHDAAGHAITATSSAFLTYIGGERYLKTKSMRNVPIIGFAGASFLYNEFKFWQFGLEM